MRILLCRFCSSLLVLEIQLLINVSYFPAVSGSATNLDEFAPLVLKLTIINVSSTKSAEGATPNRAVRKGCYIDIF